MSRHRILLDGRDVTDRLTRTTIDRVVSESARSVLVIGTDTQDALLRAMQIHQEEQRRRQDRERLMLLMEEHLRVQKVVGEVPLPLELNLGAIDDKPRNRQERREQKRRRR